MDPNIKIAQVEQHLNESLQIISSQMNQIHESLLRIADGFTSQDLVLAAIKNVLITKGVVTDSEIDAKIKELVELINKKKAKEKAPPTLEQEVEKMGQSFSNSENPEHPSEAFFFGG